jgi:hypothetical protein
VLCIKLGSFVVVLAEKLLLGLLLRVPCSLGLLFAYAAVGQPPLHVLGMALSFFVQRLLQSQGILFYAVQQGGLILLAELALRTVKLLL